MDFRNEEWPALAASVVANTGSKMEVPINPQPFVQSIAKADVGGGVPAAPNIDTATPRTAGKSADDAMMVSNEQGDLQHAMGCSMYI